MGQLTELRVPVGCLPTWQHLGNLTPGKAEGHVRPEDFAAGFFERLEALQGHRNTLYVSSIASMSTVEDTVGYTRAKIIQQFPDLTSHALPWVIAEALVVLAVAVAVRLWT
jgi:hypothetical protein